MGQSRNIIRFWLDKARRRLRLKHIVEPLIRRARGAECEQCLSRKQLQVEYEVDIDQMIQMYENMFPSDVEIDQVQWKTFWMRNQHYHTICMACIAQRKDKRREAVRQGRPELANLDDEVEEYPDWGPVFLSAASKAILLNWYRKAQQQRALKKSRKKKEKQEKKVVSDDEVMKRQRIGLIRWRNSPPRRRLLLSSGCELHALSYRRKLVKVGVSLVERVEHQH